MRESARVKFELLGELRVVDGDRDVTPARPKQQALLALLLLRRAEIVPGTQLIEALWGEEPPGTAQTALHGHVSALRKLIGAERIKTRPPGYLLQAAPGEVDVACFESLVAQARQNGDPGERSAVLREALALWHGTPLAQLRGEAFAEREIARLEELRLGALEDRIDADLALGRQHDLAPELEPLVAEHPFRERLRGQLMLALYRCGRQADALQAFRSGRQALVEELGIDPGRALQQLELRILRQDPGLELPAPDAPPPPEPERHPLVGRGDELDQLEHALRRARSGSGSIALIAGDAGIGKTRLTGELVVRARGAGFTTLAGRCLDLIGTELPYQPFVDALGALPEPAAGSQLRLFEAVLARLGERAPLLVVLEDLHWADASTLDLVVFLAHNVRDRRVLLVATHRADEPASAERMHRLAEGVRRSGAALELELGPLPPGELSALLAARGCAPAVTGAIVARCEGNPFFAEELLAAGGELPGRLRDLLLRRLARLDRGAKAVLRLASAAGRDVGYPLLHAASALPEDDVREALRAAVEHGILVADRATGRFRFRHALLADAIYGTLLPGEREAVHARLAEELARAEPPTAAAELAPHWAAAGRPAEALVASIAAAREAEAVFGLAEALAHLERAVALWAAVPHAAELVGLDQAGLTSWAAYQAVLTGAAPRAVDLCREAIALLGDGDPARAGLLHSRLGRYLNLAGQREASLTAFQRAVELVPPEPPSAERAQVLAGLGHILMLTWRHEESRAISEQALALARAVGARAAENRALIVLGVDLTYLGYGDDGLATLRQALRIAEKDGPADELFRAYACLTDALMMLGRPRESARLAAEAEEVIRPYGIEYSVLLANRVQALVACGEWKEADRVSAAALLANTANWPHNALLARAEVEIGLGDFESAHAHLEAALASVREDVRGSFVYEPVAIELALWEGRWTDAGAAVRDALARASAPDAALARVQLCALGLRAQAELGGSTRTVLACARRAAEEAAPVTPNAAAWLALAECEDARARRAARPQEWSAAAVRWEHLERPPLAAYCRWRQAEALVAAGAGAATALAAAASPRASRPLLRELERLAERVSA